MARRDEPEGDQWQREERAQQLRRVEGEAVIEGCSEEGTFAVDPERRSIHAGRHCSKPSQVADDVDYEGRKICAEVDTHGGPRLLVIGQGSRRI